MRGSIHKYIIGAIILLMMSMLTGCTSLPRTGEQDSVTLSHPPKPQTYVFECEDKYSFVARHENQVVWLFLPHKTVNLHQAPSDSGLKFCDGKNTFWLENNNATLAYGNEYYQDCPNNRARAIWEHAKLNGVDFRAVGNEPGWYMEIYESNKLLFVADYGEVRYDDFYLPEPEVFPHARKTIYIFAIDEHELEITIEGKLCHDTMVEEQYESKVTVNLDGKKYHGCGKPLH
jgi:uncharacterized membrane protein/membrane-bound inhibitor of C-type lysozyme